MKTEHNAIKKLWTPILAIAFSRDIFCYKRHKYGDGFRVGEKKWREIQILSYLYEVMTIMDFFLNVFMGVLGVGCGGLVNRIIIIDHSRPFIGIISNSCNRTSGGSCRFSIFLLDGAEQGPLPNPSPIGVASWGVPLLGLHKLFIIFSFKIRVIY